MDEHIVTEITARLRAAEAEHKVRILFAVESGSRAWGFASPDSDYDVRFVYAHPPEWYQAVDLEERRDVIEYEIVDDIDLNGWDVRKALRLFWKSNPTFVEWIQSPIVYLERSAFRELAMSALPAVYSPLRGIYHYRNLAKNNYREHLRGSVVRLKKYFYVLRALLAVRWILRTGAAAPIEFEKLLTVLTAEPEVVTAVLELLERKRNLPELGRAAAIPVLDDFIEAEFDTPPPETSGKSGCPGVVDRLNAIFHAVLQEEQAVCHADR